MRGAVRKANDSGEERDVRGFSAVLVGLVVMGALGAACDTAPGETTPVCKTEATLTSLQENYFARSCVFSACHEKGSSDTDLDLETVAGLHGRLVNVLAEDEKASARGKLLVVPNDPDASFMVQKVSDTMETDEGVLMPNGAEEPISVNCGIAKLREWITAGAPDN